MKNFDKYVLINLLSEKIDTLEALGFSDNLLTIERLYELMDKVERL